MSSQTNGSGPAHSRIAIVGAGFSGIGMGARLLQEGIDDFVVLERADELGGTWRDNTYPGCQCDIPSALYSYSFAPNPDWSRAYPLQSEIRDYLHRCARELGVVPHIRLGHEVTGAEWDEAEQCWRLETSKGRLSANILVGGMGGLTEPAVPDIPGIGAFEGAMFHSAQWDHEHDLSGERVAAIGTGASAVQFVPMIQPMVGRLHLFQRTPSWVMPDPDRRVSDFERDLYRRFPITQRALRAALYAMHETTVLGTIVDRRLSTVFEQIARQHLKRQVADPELRAKLTPNYTLGCKRITMSNTYYPALTQPNAEVVTDPIREIRARSIVTADGTEREIDTLILGTGFKVFDNPSFDRVRGRGGRSLRDVWQGSPRAYLGTAIAGFPNLFLLVGPNSAGGYNSIIFTSEAHINYVVRAIKAMERRGIGAIEVRREAYEEFTRETERRLEDSVWNKGGCASWYLDQNGRNGVWWPGFTWRLWQRTRRFDAGNYLAEPAPARAEPVAA
ncbi:MAG TPA: NAD(P)/FAD-dependent oxidoreductase [Solirubrobacterales bacterium]|nr:NAD(P)/FAD-dependent oxidoreductase [Solirubrobacterales bacterium]